jgi:hypothetical protein
VSDEDDRPLSARDRAFAVELARCGGLPERLLAVHVDDGSGRCTECSGGGQSARYRFPCSLQILATEALVIRGRTQLDSGTRPPWLRGRGDNGPDPR